MWDLRRPANALFTFPTRTPIKSIAYDPLMQVAASGSSESNIALWDIHRLEPLYSLPYSVDLGTGWVSSVLLTPNGKLVSGSWDTTIQMYDFACRNSTHFAEQRTQLAALSARAKTSRYTSSQRTSRTAHPKRRSAVREQSAKRSKSPKDGEKHKKSCLLS